MARKKFDVTFKRGGETYVVHCDDQRTQGELAWVLLGVHSHRKGEDPVWVDMSNIVANPEALKGEPFLTMSAKAGSR